MFLIIEHLLTKMEHLLKAGIYQVIRALHFSKVPLHLRDLAKKSNFSLQGTTRVVNYLTKSGALEEQRMANLRRLKINYSHPDCIGIITSIDIERIKKLPKLIQGALEEFCQTFDNQFIVLFGSYAKGNYSAQSDIDIFVYVRNIPLKNPDVTTLNSKYGVRINCIFSDDISTNAQKHILNTGIPLNNQARFYQEYGKTQTFSN